MTVTVPAPDLDAARASRKLHLGLIGWTTATLAMAFGYGPRMVDGRLKFDDWQERTYRWPAQRQMVLANVERAVEAGADVYVCPALRATDRRRQGEALPGLMVWADVDDDASPDAVEVARDLDAALVASGRPGHFHVYVRLASSVDSPTLETLNRALARRLGGDAKWADNSLLRLAGTLSHKSDPAAPVDWLTPPGEAMTRWSPDVLLEYLGGPVDDDAPRRERRGEPIPAGEPLPAPLPAHLARILAAPVGPDRSEQIYGAVAAGLEMGFTDGQVVTLVGEMPAGRDRGQVGRDTQLALDKLRPAHNHPGHPCDRAGCPNSPRWMSKDRVSTFNPRRDGAESATTAQGSTSGTSGTASEREAWPDPIPLAARLPAFPLDVMPGPVGRIVDAVAASTQTPRDLAAFTALAALSIATRGRYRIVVRPGWVEQTALYVVALADSGARKTAVVRAVGEPLFTLEREARRGQRDDYLAAAAAYRILERQAKAAEDAAAKPLTDPVKRDAAMTVARDLAVTFGSTPKPSEFRLLADDVTPEKLAMLMADQGGPMGVLSAEGGLLGTLAGRYSDNASANVDLVLKAYDAEPVRVDRVGRASVDLERPFLAMGLIVQPDVIAEATKVRVFTERGLLPRVLYSLPRTTVGTRALDAPDVPTEMAVAWHVCLTRIYSEAPSEGQVALNLDGEARKALDAFRADLEPRLHPDIGDLTRICAWASKLPGALIRIAGLFALVDGAGLLIRGEHMTAAVDLGDYLIAHALAALALDERRRDARQVAALTWIRRKSGAESAQTSDGDGSGTSGTTFTARDAWRGLHGQVWAETAADVQAVLDQLEELGWIRRLPDPARRAGRPPSPTYEAHPLVRAERTRP